MTAADISSSSVQHTQNWLIVGAVLIERKNSSVASSAAAPLQVLVWELCNWNNSLHTLCLLAKSATFCWPLQLLHTEQNISKYGPRAHSFGQFKKHALLKARTRSPCFSYPGPARAFISAGSADLSSFGGIGVGWAPDLPCRLSVYDWAKMLPVYSLIVGHTDFLSLFCKK